MEDSYFTILWWFWPYIGLTQPQVHMCPASWTHLPRTLPSGLSQSTDFGCPVSRIKPAVGETGSEPVDHQGSPQEMNPFFSFFNSSFSCVWHVKNYFALTFLNFVLFFRKWCQNSKQGAFVLFSRVFVFIPPGKRAMFWLLSLYFCYSSAKAHAVV